MVFLAFLFLSLSNVAPYCLISFIKCLKFALVHFFTWMWYFPNKIKSCIRKIFVLLESTLSCTNRNTTSFKSIWIHFPNNLEIKSETSNQIFLNIYFQKKMNHRFSDFKVFNIQTETFKQLMSSFTIFLDTSLILWLIKKLYVVDYTFFQLKVSYLAEQNIVE